MTFSRITSSMFPRQASSPDEASSSAATSRKTSSSSNEMLSPLLASRPGKALADARDCVMADNTNKLQELLRNEPRLLMTPFENKETLLTEAACAGKQNAVQAILMQAVLASDVTFEDVVNHRNAKGGTALTLAIQHNHLDVAQSLLGHAEVAKGNPGLAGAIRKGRPDVAKLQVALGSQNGKLNSAGKSFSQARSAAMDGDILMLEALLDQNPELLTMQRGNKETLLTLAASAGMVSSLQVILKQARRTQPDHLRDIVNHRNGNGDTALAQATQRGKLDVVVSLLACAETDVNLANGRGETALHHAATVENPKLAEQLLRHRSISPNLADENGNTPLHVAIMRGRSDTAVKIAAHPAAVPDQANREHSTPLEIAVDMEDLTVFDALLNNDKVDPNRTLGPNGRGLSPFWQVLEESSAHVWDGGALSRWQQMLGMLVASPRVNANIRIIQGNTRETPLTYLCKLQPPWDMAPKTNFTDWQVKTVKTLLVHRQRDMPTHSLNPNAKNSAGQTAYQVAEAQEIGSQALVEALLSDPGTLGPASGASGQSGARGSTSS